MPFRKQRKRLDFNKVLQFIFDHFNNLNISKSMFRHYREVFWPHTDFVLSSFYWQFFFNFVLLHHLRAKYFERSPVFLALNFNLPNVSSCFFVAKFSAVKFISSLLPKLSIELKYSNTGKHAWPVSGLVTTFSVSRVLKDTLEFFFYFFWAIH